MASQHAANIPHLMHIRAGATGDTASGLGVRGAEERSPHMLRSQAPTLADSTPTAKPKGASRSPTWDAEAQRRGPSSALPKSFAGCWIGNGAARTTLVPIGSSGIASYATLLFHQWLNFKFIFLRDRCQREGQTKRHLPSAGSLPIHMKQPGWDQASTAPRPPSSPQPSQQDLTYLETGKIHMQGLTGAGGPAAA